MNQHLDVSSENGRFSDEHPNVGSFSLQYTRPFFLNKGQGNIFTIQKNPHRSHLCKDSFQIAKARKLWYNPIYKLVLHNFSVLGIKMSLLEAQADFGLNLLRANPNPNAASQSTIISPISISIALAMCYAGAKNPTANQISQAIAGGLSLL